MTTDVETTTLGVFRRTASVAGGWIDAGDAVAAGVLVAVEGSAPMDPGVALFVRGDGVVEGSVTSGCVEGAIAGDALELLRGEDPARMLTFGISDELAGSVGLACGGTVHVLVHRLDGATRAATRAALEAIARDRPVCVVRMLDGPGAGETMAVFADRRVGTLGGPGLLDDNAEREARALLAQGATVVRRFGADGAKLGEDVRVLFASHAQPPEMAIVGAGDFAAALAPMARRLGFRVTISDPRSAFANAPRLAQDADVVVAWPQEALSRTELGPRDAVVVLSHDAKLDVPALLAAFASDAGYIGALGSRRTTADRERRLREAGATDEDVARLHAPCGLDIGSATPDEVALSILAEIVALRSGRGGASLRGGEGPIRRRQDDPS